MIHSKADREKSEPFEERERPNFIDRFQIGANEPHVTTRGFGDGAALAFSSRMRASRLAVCVLAPVFVFACADTGKGLGSQHGDYGGDNGDGVDETGGEHDPGSNDPGSNATTEESAAAEAAPAAPTGTATTSGGFKATLSTATPASDLGEKVSFDVTIEQQATFTGKVDLVAEKLPTGVTATFEPAQVDVGATPVKSKVTLTTAIDAAPGSTEITVKGTSGAQMATAPANFKVNNVVTMKVPVNINAMRTTGNVVVDAYGVEFGKSPKAIGAAGQKTLVKVQNLDSTTHIIHSGGEFGHGDQGNPMAAGGGFELAGGQPRMRSLSSGSTANGYLHEGQNGTSVSWTVRVR